MSKSSNTGAAAPARTRATRATRVPKIIVTDITLKPVTFDAGRLARAARSYGGYTPYKLNRPTQTPCGGVKFRRSIRHAKAVGEAKSFTLYSLP